MATQQLKKECLICNMIFFKKTRGMARWLERKYCSRACVYKSQVGKEFAESSREKLRVARTGKKRPPLSDEWKNKISAAMSRRILSSEHKQRISLARMGHSVSDAVKTALSKAHKGKIISQEQRKKLSEAGRGKRIGPLNHMWKGGISPINTRIRNSAESRDWRSKVFKRDDFTCQQCGERGGKINADHIKPFCLFPELRFDINNGRTLCESCHKKTPTWGIKARYFLTTT